MKMNILQGSIVIFLGLVIKLDADIPLQLDPAGICTYPLDLIFVLDGSESVKSENFLKVTTFVVRLLSHFIIHGDHTRVGVIEFSDRVGTTINLNNKLNYSDLSKQIQGIQMSKGYTLTHLAIQKMSEQFMLYSRESSGVPQVGVVITDGKSLYPNYTKYAAGEAHSNGVVLYAIGIGGTGVFEEELSTIATDSNKKITVNNFDALPPNLDNNICSLAQRSLFSTPSPTTRNILPTTVVNGDSDGGRGGIDQGYQHHGDVDCTQYIVEWPKGVRTHMKCPFGQFWDSRKITCDFSAVAYCKNDPCRGGRYLTVPMSGVCSGFWVCLPVSNLGYRAFPTCCPSGEKYIDGNGCIKGSSCLDACPELETPRLEGACNRTSVPGDITSFEERVHDVTIIRRCALGSAFDGKTCDCSNFVTPNPLPTSNPLTSCHMEIFLPLNDSSDLRDHSGRQIAIDAQNIEVGDNMAVFDGTSSCLNIWRFANVELRGVIISMKIRAPASDDVYNGKYQALLTNCEFDENKCNSSFALYLDRNQHVVISFVRLVDGSAHFLSAPYDAGGLVINNIEFGVTLENIMTLTVNGMSRQYNLRSTTVDSRQTGFVLGGGGGMYDRYKGKMCDVKVVQCY